MKHYPGHGATTADTRTGYASTDATLEEMKGNELVPFIEGICLSGSNYGGLTFPAPGIVTGDTVPASLSKKMITDILRTDLGYQGLGYNRCTEYGSYCTGVYFRGGCCFSYKCRCGYVTDASGLP